MSVDFGSRGAALYRMIMRDVDETIRRRLSGLSASVAAMKDGAGVSDGHRVFNFTGNGVTVTDDSAARRTNINVPGGPAALSTTTIISNTGATVKGLTLWNGSTNIAPPANWNLRSFSDAGWSGVVISGQESVMSYAGITGTHIVWPENPGRAINEQALVRHTFTLPSGIISGAVLTVAIDGPCHAGYLNDVNLSLPTNTTATWGPGGPTSPTVRTISPSVLTPGGSNVLALWGENENPSSGDTPSYYGSVSYRLVVTYTVAGAPVTNQLAADVTCTTANTFYDGPTVTVPAAGSWLLTGTVTLYNATAASNMQWTVELYDATNNVHLASMEVTQPDNLKVAAAAVSWAVSPTASTIYKIRATCTTGNGKILSGNGATAISNQVGNNASSLTAWPG